MHRRSLKVTRIGKAKGRKATPKGNEPYCAPWELEAKPVFSHAHRRNSDPCEQCGKAGGTSEVNGKYLCSHCLNSGMRVRPTAPEGWVRRGNLLEAKSSDPLTAKQEKSFLRKNGPWLLLVSAGAILIALGFAFPALSFAGFKLLDLGIGASVAGIAHFSFTNWVDGKWVNFLWRSKLLHPNPKGHHGPGRPLEWVFVLAGVGISVALLSTAFGATPTHAWQAGAGMAALGGASLVTYSQFANAWKYVLGKPSIVVSSNGATMSGQESNLGADYGPDTPGTTTSGIQEAVNAIKAAGKGTVNCLPGTYIIPSLRAITDHEGESIMVGVYIDSSMNFICDGVITIANDINANPSLPNMPFMVDGTSHVYVRIREIDGNRANQSTFQTNGIIYGIDVRGSSHVNIDRCYVHSTVETGIAFEDECDQCEATYNTVLDIGTAGSSSDANALGSDHTSTNCRFIGNECQSNIAAGIIHEGNIGHVDIGNSCHNCNNAGIVVLNTASYPTLNVGSCQVIGNECYANSGSGIAALGNSSAITVDSIVINGNLIHDNAGHGIILGELGVASVASSSQISGNESYRNDLNGIYITGSGYSGTRVIGNSAYNNAFGGANQSGIVIDNVTDCIVTGNVAYDNQATKTQQYGIATVDSEARALITDNVVSGNLTAAMLLQGTGDVVHGNLGFNPLGFTVTTPSFPATATNVQNTNPFPVRIYLLTAGTMTAFQITDPAGNVQAISTAPVAGQEFTLDPGANIQFTYTVAATWKWYGI